MAASEAESWLANVYHLPEQKIADHLRQGKILATLKETAEGLGVLSTGVPKHVGVLLYKVATTLSAPNQRTLLGQYVVSEKIKASGFPFAQEFIKKTKLPFSEDPNSQYVKELEAAAGVGLPEPTAQEITGLVAALLATKEAELETKRYQLKSFFLGEARKTAPLKFAPAAQVVTEITAQLEARLGKETDPINAIVKTSTPKSAPSSSSSSSSSSTSPSSPSSSSSSTSSSSTEPEEEEEEDTLPSSVEYPPPEANKQLRPELLEKHLRETGGMVITRFPPEPNGYLHIGHCKAANLDFGYAKRKGGQCILRYDDTNPEAEKQEYIDAIAENVGWLGWTPVRVTYSSDYFDQLYQFAEDLINRGFGYTCNCAKQDMREKRALKEECTCRSKPKEQSLAEFRDMRDGKYEAGAMCLRMKGDMKSPNPCMRDHVAYRIKNVPHPRTGDKWRIYPTYDYTHCIVDSLENITHSLCSLEFNVRRESYEWLLHVLDIYCPPQREFSRLDISYTVLSKRKLLKLISAGVVSGWDDPLMPTLMGVRRRGFRPQALNKLCERVGITRVNNLVDFRLLEHLVREDLEDITNRAFAVLDPLRVEITNWESDKVVLLDAPHHISFPERGSRKIPLSRVVYIERKDFRTEDDPTYYGLTPGKLARLRYSGFIRADSFELDEQGQVSLVRATFLEESPKKVKGVLHWLSEPAPGVSPRTAEVRLLDRLFTHPQPGSLKDEELLAAINPNARKIVPNAFIESHVLDAIKIGDSVQFERLGFFCLDNVDSTPEKPVFNRIVPLRDSYALELIKKEQEKKSA